MNAVLSAILLAAAALFFFRHWRYGNLGGLPAGSLIAESNAPEEVPLLLSHRYGLKGRPDALVRTGDGNVIPVERKRSTAPRRPYDGDVIQGIAYCILVEDTYGTVPPYVRIQYADRWFDVAYTPERKAWVLAVTARLRHAKGVGAADRSHRNQAKCHGCSQRSNCDQALTAPRR